MTSSSITFTAVVIRFTLGGGAVAIAFVLSRLMGSKWGGIFAAFPAVYIAAIVTVTMGLPNEMGTPLALQVSKGALVGMLGNIISAIAAYRLILRHGWQQGLLGALGVWAVVVSLIYGFIHMTGLLG